MAKVPKFRLPFLRSIQICRPKDPSSLVKTPLSMSTNFFSRLNSTTFDISLLTFPSPPPSTPNDPSPKRGFDPSKTSSLGLSEDVPTRSEYNDEMHNDFPISSDPDDEGDCEKRKGKIKKKKSKDSVSTTITSSGNKPMKQRSARARRFKRYGSKEWVETERPFPERSVTTCMVDGEVMNLQSFVVVKRSVDPYEDFKNSMIEMILEKQMFEPRELEQLLMSFLSLNSKLHHKVIVEAFTEIWKEMLCG